VRRDRRNAEHNPLPEIEGAICSRSKSLDDGAAIVITTPLNQGGERRVPEVYLWLRGRENGNGCDMSVETDVAAFRRGYAAGVAGSECDEEINTYAAGHLAGRTAFMAYWIAELEAGKVEADEAFQPLPASMLMRLAMRLESGRASRLAKALSRLPASFRRTERLSAA
jgi:hypothetical protein